MLFARAIISKVSVHIHPDKFVKESEAKQRVVRELTTNVNKIVNRLKGLS